MHTSYTFRMPSSIRCTPHTVFACPAPSDAPLKHFCACSALSDAPLTHLSHAQQHPMHPSHTFRMPNTIRCTPHILFACPAPSDAPLTQFLHAQRNPTRRSYTFRMPSAIRCAPHTLFARARAAAALPTSAGALK